MHRGMIQVTKDLTMRSTGAQVGRDLILSGVGRVDRDFVIYRMLLSGRSHVLYFSDASCARTTLRKRARETLYN